MAEVVGVIPIVRNSPFQRPDGSITHRDTNPWPPVLIVWVVSAVPFAVYGVILFVYTVFKLTMLQPPVLGRSNSLLTTTKYGVVEVTEETLASTEYEPGPGIAQVVVGLNVATRPLVPNEVSTTSEDPDDLRPTRTEDIYDSDCPMLGPDKFLL
jgi:hypothetical protein